MSPSPAHTASIATGSDSRFSRPVSPGALSPRARDVGRDRNKQEARRSELSAEEDELSDDQSPPRIDRKSPRRRGDVKGVTAANQARKGSCSDRKLAASKGKSGSATTSPNPSLAGSETRFERERLAMRPDGPARGSMPLHLAHNDTDAKQARDSAAVDRDRDAQTRPYSPQSIEPGPLRSQGTSSPAGVAAAGLRSSLSEQLGWALQHPNPQRSGHHRNAFSSSSIRLDSRQPQAEKGAALSHPGHRHSGQQNRMLPPPSRAVGAVAQEHSPVPSRGPQGETASVSADTTHVPFDSRNDLNDEEVDIFLDLIIKHQPETLSPEEMTKSVNALYDEWLGMSTTSSIVAKPKKALMEEYDKIYRGYYGPAAASRARWIAEESARASLEPARRLSEGAARRPSLQSPTRADLRTGAGRAAHRRSPQRSDPGSIGRDSKGPATPPSLAQQTDRRRSSATSGTADAESRTHDVEGRKRKGQEGGSPSAGDRSQRRRMDSTEVLGDSSGGSASGIAKVGRNGLAVLPPGLFEILRNHLKDEILGGIVPLIRSDLAEQSRDILMQNQEVMSRLRTLEEVTRNQDVWIRRLLAREQSDWAPQAEEIPAWDAKKPFRSDIPAFLASGSAGVDGAYPDHAQKSAGSASALRRVTSGAEVAWQTGESPLFHPRRGEHSADGSHGPGPAAPRPQAGSSFDARLMRNEEGMGGRLSPLSRSSGGPPAVDRPEMELRGPPRPVQSLSDRTFTGPGPPRDRHRHSLSVDDWRLHTGLPMSGFEPEAVSTPSSFGAKYAYGSPRQGHAQIGGAPPTTFRGPPPPLARGPRLMPDSPSRAAGPLSPRRAEVRRPRPQYSDPPQAAGFVGFDSRSMIRPPADLRAHSPRHR